MKTTILLTFVAMLTTAAVPQPFASESTCEHMAQQVITAFQKTSPEAYTALFPSLAEFHALMDENANVYGETLEAAKEEFAARYKNDILPLVKKSFVSILQEGSKKGIDWSQINFEGFECSTPDKTLSSVSFTIVFSANRKEYWLTIGKAFVLHDEWKVSSEISLI